MAFFISDSLYKLVDFLAEEGLKNNSWIVQSPRIEA